jgi:hypothetical protein
MKAMRETLKEWWLTYILFGVAGPIFLYCAGLGMEDEGRFWAAEHLQAAAFILAVLSLVVLLGTRGREAAERQDTVGEREAAQAPGARTAMREAAPRRTPKGLRGNLVRNRHRAGGAHLRSAPFCSWDGRGWSSTSGGPRSRGICVERATARCGGIDVGELNSAGPGR